jgi:hypothetical protein
MKTILLTLTERQAELAADACIFYAGVLALHNHERALELSQIDTILRENVPDRDNQED